MGPNLTETIISVKLWLMLEICAILDGIYANMDHDIDLHTTYHKDPERNEDQH